MNKIWDSHNHWMPPQVAENTTFFKVHWSDSDVLLKTLDGAGVEKAVLLYPTSDAHLNMGGWSKVCSVYNQAIADKVKEYPSRFIGAGILPVDQPSAMVAEVGRIKELGLSALSLGSSYDGKFLDDEMFLPVFEKAEKYNLPIFVHAQVINPIGFERVKDPLLMPVLEYVFDVTMCAGKLMMSEIYTKFPSLKFIFAHFAGVMPFVADRFDATYSMLRMRNSVKDLGQAPTQILKNLFVDTSGTKSKPQLEMALEFFGPERIIWGSDFPAKRDLDKSIETVNALTIDEKSKQAILTENIQSIFNQGA
ncbi:amidohydrolase family protein [Candidatus Omnitrophota bacterium]